jgi:hypothetical protein
VLVNDVGNAYPELQLVAKAQKKLTTLCKSQEREREREKEREREREREKERESIIEVVESNIEVLPYWCYGYIKDGTASTT